MPPKVRARARVRVLLEVVVPDVWGDDCQVSQVHKQARESAARILLAGLGPAIKVVGPMQVETISTEEAP